MEVLVGLLIVVVLSAILLFYVFGAITLLALVALGVLVLLLPWVVYGFVAAVRDGLR